MKWFLIKVGTILGVSGLTVYLLFDTLGTWRTILTAALLAILAQVYLDQLQDDREPKK